MTGAITLRGAPGRITVDGYPATHAAIAELKKDGVLRPELKAWTSRYLNNLGEQDHRGVKQRLHPLLGFKSPGKATTAISGVELAQEIRKGQFDTGKLTGGGVNGRVRQMWEVALAGW